MKFGDKIKKIAEHSFQHNKFVEKITVPSSIETIGDYAFACKNLKSVELNEGLKKQGTMPLVVQKLIQLLFQEAQNKSEHMPFQGAKDYRQLL